MEVKALEHYRKLFPVVERYIYLNHAATSPYSKLVAAALQERIERRLSENVDDYELISREIQELRDNFGRLINSEPGRIAITKNTSEGLNIVASGLKWKPGDRILIYDQEFPANVWPFLNLQHLGVVIDFFSSEDGRIDLELIKRHLKPSTRLLTLSFVQFLNGFRSDLKAIARFCKEKNIILVIDGIQGVGVIPLNIKEVDPDALTCGAHKWLMGLQGVGFLYLKPEFFQGLQPAYTGWLSVEKPWEFFNHDQKLKKDVRLFEYATYNSNGIVGTNAALKLLLEVGTERIYKQVISLGNYLVQGLKSSGYEIISHLEPECRSGITLFSHPDKSRNQIVYNRLREKGIIISYREGYLRVAPHFYNTLEEISILVDICRKSY